MDWLYKGRTVAVRSAILGPGPCAITFQSARFDGVDPNWIDQQGFAETFFSKRGLNAIHVLPSHNHWYQAETEAVVKAITGATKGRALTTYGSSMGAYASIRFAPAIGAKRVLALSPQFSIDPEKAPFEQRFTRFFRRDKFVADTFDSAAYDDIATYVIYGAFDADAEHARLIAEAVPNSQLLPIRFGGHPIGPILKESGLLTSMTLGLVLKGEFDEREFRSVLRATRRQSANYMRALYQAARTRRYSRRVLAIGRAALEISALNDKLRGDLASRALDAGDLELAKRALSEADLARIDNKTRLRLGAKLQRQGAASLAAAVLKDCELAV
ncbi:MAG: hypothetical protein B7Y99_03100 [Caulobacterales bacterium 32-69-10]|nr:MAG: hypothetical protein B7Y99_03100 [Caulobacterales bacterium 32-69-10]